MPRIRGSFMRKFPICLCSRSDHPACSIGGRICDRHRRRCCDLPQGEHNSTTLQSRVIVEDVYATSIGDGQLAQTCPFPQNGTAVAKGITTVPSCNIISSSIGGWHLDRRQRSRSHLRWFKSWGASTPSPYRHLEYLAAASYLKRDKQIGCRGEILQMLIWRWQALLASSKASSCARNGPWQLRLHDDSAVRPRRRLTRHRIWLSLTISVNC